MNLILRYLEGRKSAPATNPKLSQELKDVRTQLNSILNKWKFGDTPITTSQEFLANFEPWINRQLEQQKELKTFLAKKGVNNLQEADTKLANRDLSENEELEQVRQELAEKEQTWQNTEQDYLRQIRELKENRELPEDYEDLITERDQLARDKRTLEQEVLATNNRLNNKTQELKNKEKSLDKLQKEASEKEISLNKKLTELKEKYSKQGKLLDTEQLEAKKLEEKVEALEAEIRKLKEGQT